MKLLLAFSGGLDSRVLLELLAALRSGKNFNLSAMHVHHGLSPNANAWARFCSDTCAALHVPIEIVRVNVAKDSGLGLEAAARNARYQALLNTDADYVALAHHQDDQAETLLLQLLRGAGAKGLSGMALRDKERRLLRPLLDISRAELLAFAKQHDLQWITDESNDDISYDRNYCRHEVFPIIEKRFPAAKQTLARSASHLAEAAMLLDELARLDIGQVDAAQIDSVQLQKQLDLAVLASLSEPRARNLLRWWLSANSQSLPSTIRLQEMLRQLLTAKADARVKIAINSAEGVYLRRYQGFAYLESNSHSLPIALLWQGEAELRLPDNSRLVFEKKLGCGLAFKRLGINKLRIAHRTGGERFKPDLAKPTRTLKHLLQEADMPPWQRERLPLVYCDDVLAVVPGIGVACTMQARADETGLTILWQQV
ncbi:MAG TPA: tRNA lysidine(34) synthetase TilS [Methylophilaceae bacterium]|nr:tRNA lysidine(34) synthetase TilS [Methylophilaceae bacterium]